jgi:hypothetical protein
MRLVTRTLLAASVVVLGAAVAFPQSLAEIAAREKERQEKVKRKTGGATKVITEDDLRGRGAGTYSQPGATGAPTASPSPGASPGPAGEKPKTDEELRAEAEKAWREKLQHFQSEAARLTGLVADLQAGVSDSSVGVYSAGRARQVSRLEEAQKSLAAAKQQVADIEEEGRRNRYR